MIICTILYLQMVGLYKDPKGDTIFDKSKSTVGGTMNNNLQTQTIEGLKNKVTELEAIVASTGGSLVVRFFVCVCEGVAI